MRIIHTADWHLGNQMHEIDRSVESGAFLDWLLQQITDLEADVLIVSGDVFDTAHPSVGARRQYYDFLARAVKDGLGNIIITGGNHDSAVLLDAAKELLGVSGVRVVGSVSGISPKDMVFELTGKAGETCGICMAVPFVREVELRNCIPETVEDGDVYSQAYCALYTAVYEEAEKLRAGRHIPLVATGHLYAADLEGRLSGAKSNEKTDDGVKVLDVLGTLGNVPVSVFPEQADYVALGHIHYTTTVAKNPRVRYSGSPFVLGFDEALIPRTILCVDVEAEKQPAVEKIEVPAFSVYRRISGTLAEVKQQLQSMAEAHASIPEAKRKPVYLEICYKKELGLSAQEYLEPVLAALPASLSVASWKPLEQKSAAAFSGFASMDASELKNLDDTAVFTELILSKAGFQKDSPEAKAALDVYLPLFAEIAAGVAQGEE
ncbi:MAG: exonuclease subunit SbcD [Treponema sp.]|nr:exonuclease subunit SbcD [Treponema sp.]